MRDKSVITYAGDNALFQSLEPLLSEGLPKEMADWSRTYGRATRQVYVNATFSPFSNGVFPVEGKWHVINQPVLHTFWTDCVDLDVYKTSVKEDIETWLKILSQHNIPDWMIIIVETYDIRKTNKLLPRTTVLDKIRADFASKQGDRCVSVINPVKSESRSAESWRGMLARIRTLVLSAYNRILFKFEEFIRDQRERRNEPGWNFSNYFLLQEELAFVLEMLGVYDEALIQYDELDALFTQFVLNSSVAENPSWLSTFQHHSENWSGITLDHKLNEEQRRLLSEGEASLLEFRSYLFTRQCTMLQLLESPDELAKRTLPFLHNCLKELEILEISSPAGSVACWVFLCCLEVLEICCSFQEPDQVEACSPYMAPLWAYAKDKLHELGEMCGLMPGSEPTSEQLHMVVNLSAGMRDPQSEGGNTTTTTPTDKLKEALSSKESFKKHYLELAELAMGTYKHIGWIRSARLLGKGLAQFYIRMGDLSKAYVYLMDALKMFEDERWRNLTIQTQIELVDCCKLMGNTEKLVKTCAVLAGAHELDYDSRISYLDCMYSGLATLGPDSPITTSLSDCFNVMYIEVNLGNNPIIENSDVQVTMEIDCLLLRDVTCPRICISLEEVSESSPSDGIPNPRPQEQATARRVSTAKKQEPSKNIHNYRYSREDSKPVNPALMRLNMKEILDYKQDKCLGSASVAADNPKQFLRRTSSHSRSRKISTVSQCDFSICLLTEDVILKPGKNRVTLTTKADKKGIFKLVQVSILLKEKLQFLSELITPPVTFEVTREQPTFMLNKSDKDLLAGVKQELILSVSAGSYTIEQDAVMKLQCSRGLLIQVKNNYNPMSKEVEISLPQTNSFQSLSIPLYVLAELPTKKDGHSIEHEVTVVCPWLTEQKIVSLNFKPPFTATFRLHTANIQKFVQVVLVGAGTEMFELKEADLCILNSKDVDVIPLNPTQGQKLIVGNGMNISFMWQLKFGDVDETTPVKTEFSVSYLPVSSPLQEEEFRLYKCPYEVTDYKTLFVVRARVEPAKGNEFCRAGTMCHLQLSVQRMHYNVYNSLMYEVLADQAMWAVCGRSAGVISVENVEKQNITLDVMPLVGGFLPLPGVRLSKYIPADQKSTGKDANRKVDLSSLASTHPRLEPFSPGQVYNSSKAQQVHVLASVTVSTVDTSIS